MPGFTPAIWMPCSPPQKWTKLSQLVEFEAHLGDHPRPQRRIDEAGEEFGAAAGAHLGREDRVAGGRAGGVGIHVLHRRDERRGVGENALQLADAVVVLRPGDLRVLVAIAAAAVDRRLDDFLDAGDDGVALRAQMGKERAGLDAR